MVHQNQSNKKFKFMIEAVNTANLYSTRSSSLSLKVNINALDSTRSDILTLTELPNASWTSITSLILEMLFTCKNACYFPSLPSHEHNHRNFTEA